MAGALIAAVFPGFFVASGSRVGRFLLGPAKDPRAPGAFHDLSLVALLAWVGLGADGLSSSAYGPEEAFRQLGDHRGLAVFIAAAMLATVVILSVSYTRIIEAFPSGGGGYLVVCKILGQGAGVVSGAALLVDYVLTITISIAAGVDAIFSMLPPGAHGARLAVGLAGLALLTVMNLRGVRESVRAITPVFALFLATHAILLAVAIGGNIPDAARVATEVRIDVADSFATLGAWGTVALLLRAYSLGAGSYTGIEAVSNGVATMREPRVATARRTMTLMGTSLALMASGLVLAYLLVGVGPVAGKTMNAVLVERVAGSWHVGGLPVGTAFVVLALASEAALLFIAAQAGFIAGPRVMANLAVDSWLPHRFSALSDRLTMRNGVLLMAIAAGVAYLYTDGSVSRLVVMYAINVFVTFFLATFAMALREWEGRRRAPGWRRRALPHAAAAALCAVVLVVTIFEKFLEGGWLTVLSTAAVVALCHTIRSHYQRVEGALSNLETVVPSARGIESLREAELSLDTSEEFAPSAIPGVLEHHSRHDPDPSRPIAVVFVGPYSGLGRLAVLTLGRMFPKHFGGIVFVSVAVVDSESFKGADQVAALEARGRESLVRYERYARARGYASASAMAVGTEVTVEAERIAAELSQRYPGALFVGGQLVFDHDSRWLRTLHNETAFMIQARLQRMGLPMIVLPVRIDLRAGTVLPLPGALR